MGLQAVLWDMDGVLVDTRALHYASWVECLARYGLTYSEQEFRQTFGMNNRGVLSTILGRAPEEAFLAEVSDAKEQLFRKSVQGRARLLPGVLDWLEALRLRSIPMAVASSAPQENIDVLIVELALGGYFRATLSAYDLPGKPDPAVFLLAAQRLGAGAAGCLVIEDGIPGVQAARAAGMKCVGVTNTVTAERLQAADLVLDSLEQLTWEAIGAMFDEKG